MRVSLRHLARLVAVAGCLVAAAGASAAAGAAGPTTTIASQVVRGSSVFAVGVGFAPPNEFCKPVILRLDGHAVPILNRNADDTGTWVFRFRASQPKGLHRVTLQQTCESGQDGSLTTRKAGARFRII